LNRNIPALFLTYSDLFTSLKLLIMKKIMHFIVVIGGLTFYSCGKQSDLNGLVQPACATSEVPQQLQLDWTSLAPSYYEINSAGLQVPCTSDPFYDGSTKELSLPPYATNYNYLTQASAVPTSTLIPSDPNSSNPIYVGGAKQNELGIDESSSNYLYQITAWSNEAGQDNCTYSGYSTTGPVATTTWNTPGAIESIPVYEFSSTGAANGQSNLPNHIVVDYFDVFDVCSAVTERPYFSGVIDVEIPVGVNANSLPFTVAMTNQTPVLQ
jgi:hypothetical protein